MVNLELYKIFVTIGGPRRGDRIAKYNRLLRLEEQEKEVI